MGILGFIQEKELDENKIVEELNKLGINIITKKAIKIRTKKGWQDAIYYEVLGSSEGLAEFFSSKFNAPFFEGPIVLGEVSAKLWSEAIRIHYPSGEKEVVEIFICDSFLDAKIPTANVEGLSGYITVGSRRYSLPLSKEAIKEINSLGEAALDKIVKATEIYGNKVLDVSLLRELEEEEVREGVDYEVGYVIIMKRNKITTVPLEEYFLSLLLKDELDKAKKIYKEAPNEWKNRLKKILENEINRLKESNKDKAEKLKKIIESSN